MRDLLAHARDLGVSVHVAHLPEPYQGYYDSAEKVVVYGFDLTPVERRCVLAHELGHAFYDHQGEDDPAFERLAEEYAARLLINPEQYVMAHTLNPEQAAVAEELGVTTDLVRVYEVRMLTRLRGVTYIRARMGARQYQWRS